MIGVSDSVNFSCEWYWCRNIRNVTLIHVFFSLCHVHVKIISLRRFTWLYLTWCSEQFDRGICVQRGNNSDVARIITKGDVINRNDQYYCYLPIYISGRISNIKYVCDFTWDELAMKRTYINKSFLWFQYIYMAIIYIAVQFRYQCNSPVSCIRNEMGSEYEKQIPDQMSIPFTIAACESGISCAWLLCSIVILACIRVRVICECIWCWNRSNADFKWSQIGVIAIKTIERCLLCKLHIDM